MHRVLPAAFLAPVACRGSERDAARVAPVPSTEAVTSAKATAVRLTGEAFADGHFLGRETLLLRTNDGTCSCPHERTPGSHPPACTRGGGVFAQFSIGTAAPRADDEYEPRVSCLDADDGTVREIDLPRAPKWFAVAGRRLAFGSSDGVWVVERP